DVVQAFDSSAEGVCSENAASRLPEDGPSELPTARQRSDFMRFAAEFSNALIYFLIAAAVLAASLGHVVDASASVLVVIVNAVVGFVQEGRAEQSLNALRAMLAPTARILRDGQRCVTAVQDLVPGDLVLLEAGDRV